MKKRYVISLLALVLLIILIIVITIVSKYKVQNQEKDEQQKTATQELKEKKQELIKLCEENQEELFSAISIYSDNEELKSAAIDVKYAISDDFSKCISEMGTIMGDIGESGLELAYLLTISKVGTVGLALSAGWSIGDMIFNTGTINEELLKVIAYGDVAVAYSESLEDAIRYDCSPYYYICDESMLTELQILGQLRVVGEDKYAETSNERSFLIKWLGSLVECSQKDIEELCEDTIDEVIRRCDILKIVVSKKFKDCYF